MLTFQGDIVEYDGDFINYTAPTPPPDIYRVYCLGTHGSVSAVPDHGETGTEVTLYNYPDTGYEFVSYQMTGAYLKDANRFDIQDVNVTVSGCFQPIPTPPVPTDHDELILKFASAFDPRQDFGGFDGTWTNLGNNTWKFEGRFINLSYGWSGNSPNFEVIGGVQNSEAYVLFCECTKLTKVSNYIINGSADTTNPYAAIAIFQGAVNLEEVSITLNNIKNASQMFDMFNYSNSKLKTVNITQTGYGLENTSFMFANCDKLEYAPYLNCAASMNKAWYTYYHCYKVEGGALDMYNQLKNVSFESSGDYVDCFRDCGRDTVTGAAELAQIPSSWGGTGE